jgi:hypothetical protein
MPAAVGKTFPIKTNTHMNPGFGKRNFADG